MIFYIILHVGKLSRKTTIHGAEKVSPCNHTTCACVNNTQRCSHCSWLGVSMCNRDSGNKNAGCSQEVHKR